MYKVGNFKKVSLQQFSMDVESNRPGSKNADLHIVHEEIQLPSRATTDSAGYDFYAPYTVSLAAGESVVIPTGVRAEIDRGWVLKIYPRSGLGFKFRLRLNNTVGVIDGDYYYSDNEGHIMIKLSNEGDKDLIISKGQAIAQGIFEVYGITKDDNVTATRNGGFGSTDKQ